MDDIDLHSANLHDTLNAIVDTVPGITAQLVDGRTITGRVVSVDSSRGRAVRFTVATDNGRVELDAAACFVMRRIPTST